MSTQVQRRKGTTAQHASFTGASAELTVDTTKNTVVVHDGATAGGIPLAKETGSAISAVSLTLPNGTANAVAFLNGSKVLTSGTALTFDGTRLTVNAGSGNIQVGVSGDTSYHYSRLVDNGGQGFYFGIDNSAGSFFGAGAYGRSIYSEGSYPIQFVINSSEAMRLTSTGLGIGTTSPATKLHVQSATPVFQIQDTTSAAGGVGGTINFVAYTSGTAGANVEAQIKGVKSSANAAGELQFYTSDSSGTSQQRAMLDGLGNLGIGTSSPGAKLDVLGGNARVALAVGSATTLRGYEIATGTTVAASLKSIPDSGELRLDSGFAGYGGFTTFYTNGVSRMLLDSSGNLGLGVTPSAWDAGGKAIELAAGSIFAFSSGAAGEMDYVYNTYYNAGWKYKASSSAASLYSIQAGVYKWFNAPSGTAGNAITFTQAMTLDASGALLIGATSFAGASNSNSVQIGAGGNTGTVWVNHVNGTGSTSRYVNFAYNGTDIGSITQAGTTGVLYNVTSDQRLKENISDAASASALIDNLQVRQYNWKSDGSHQRYGFIAQELVTVAPEAVHQPSDPEDMMAVDYSKLVPMLIKEIQDLRKRLAAAGIA